MNDKVRFDEKIKTGFHEKNKIDDRPIVTQEDIIESARLFVEDIKQRIRLRAEDGMVEEVKTWLFLKEKRVGCFINVKGYSDNYGYTKTLSPVPSRVERVTDDDYTQYYEWHYRNDKDTDKKIIKQWWANVNRLLKQERIKGGLYDPTHLGPSVNTTYHYYIRV